jgi:hypothetical protein
VDGMWVVVLLNSIGMYVLLGFGVVGCVLAHRTEKRMTHWLDDLRAWRVYYLVTWLIWPLVLWGAWHQASREKRGFV